MKLVKIKEIIRATCLCDLSDIEVLHLSKSVRNAKEKTLLFYDGNSEDFAISEETLKEHSILAIVSEGDINIGLPVLKVKQLQHAYALAYHVISGSPTEHLMMLGIAGSKGKSSTIAALENAFDSLELPVGIIERERFKVGEFSLPVQSNGYQTEELCNMLTSVAKGEADYCIMEIPLRELLSGQLYGIPYKVALYTSTEVDEFNDDYDQEGGYEAVNRMFLRSEVAVVNMGDQWGQRLYESLQSQGRCVYSFGLSHDFDIYANDITFWGNKTEFELVTPEGRYPVTLKIPGRINLINALGVAATLYALEIDDERALQAISEIKGREGLLEVVPNFIGLNIFIDVAKEPRVIFDRIDTVREFTKGKLVSMLYCNESQSIASLRAAVEVASSESDLLILTEGNWEQKSFESIIGDVFNMWAIPENVMIIKDREEAINTAIEASDIKDTIVLFGRGNETIFYQGDERVYFDDREMIKLAVERK